MEPGDFDIEQQPRAQEHRAFDGFAVVLWLGAALALGLVLLPLLLG